jgi:hypothetical protein
MIGMKPVVAYTTHYIIIWLWGLCKIAENLRLIGALAENRTEQLSNGSLQDSPLLLTATSQVSTSCL